MIETEKQKIESQEFYKEALQLMYDNDCQFMLGGAFAMFQYTGIFRDTKDLDIFCKSSEYPKILKAFAEKGYRTELTDVRWLAKVFHGDYFIDIIFDTVNNICTVDDRWYERATEGEFADLPVKFIPVEELIWCKLYVQNRERNDSADVNHILLRYGQHVDWKHLLSRMDPHWHILLAQLLIFQFVYPADYRSIVPKWIFDELISRANEQYDLPSPVEKVCRGPLIDQTQYQVDIKEWNYKTCTITTI
ncbi:nucleotidyltransferase [Sphingobacterium sp. lm-10]|uniref:nucleotidyltransferase n=1 Tax=Sphingobacterium sp. lm-10 TaxID=2944904 RepID=UPI002020F966|nr:nucleotidyltransferase [Sphingobacterium sp. lm-10]MCL7987016.1 nucleotidyltransferase [Sphingobacterium sp. lm-10]